MLVALLALFVALGGPAQARRLVDGGTIRKGTIRSRQIRDRTIVLRDINPVAVRQLRETPDNSITDSKLAVGAVTSTKLGGAAVTAGKLAASAVTAVTIADGAVGTGKLSDGAVTGAKIADGSLTTNDVARFAGRFRLTGLTIGTIQRHTCWSGVPQGLAPEIAGANISQDGLLVTPLGPNFDDTKLALTARMSGSAQPSRFVLSICNATDGDFTPADEGIAFSYIVFDIP
jgi:hypothetical protein